MDEGATYQGDQELQVRQGRHDLWASLRKTLVVVASTSVVLLALRNSLTYHLQHFWGASGDFWQHQWDKIVLLCNNDPFNILVYGPTLSSYALYWTSGAMFILMDLTGKPSFLRRYKIQPGTNEPVEMTPLIKSSLWVSFNQLVAGTAFSSASFYVMCFRGYDESPLLPTFHWVLFELMICILIEEVGFYYTHRLFHHRLLYKHFHKWHHEWQSPVSVTALYTHPVEHIISNIAPIILGPILLGSHPATVWLWCGLANLSTINAHSGYHLPFFPSPEAHDYHHLKFNQCYGVLGILDRLHGTDEKFRKSRQYARNVTMFSLLPPREAFPDAVPKGKRAGGECSESYDGDGGRRCGGEVDTSLHPTGTITSPSYPEHYPEDTHCTWVIKAPHGEKIALTFVDFDVTGSDGCSGDYVSLTSDLTSEGQRFCGSQGPGDVTSDGDILVLRFASNAQGSCRGFNASYHVKEESLSCGVETSALEFTFISPDYPQPVGNDSMECSVTVDHGCESPICQLRLDFEDFQLQPPYWGDCKYDQFYAESSTPLPTLCGVNNGSHMYVNVEGRSKTDLTFLLGRLEYYLYHCYDIYGSIPEGADTSEQGHSPGHARRTRARRDVGEEGEEEKQRERVGEDRMGMMEEEEIPMALPDPSFARQGGGGVQSSSAVPVTSDVVLTTEGDVTVALYNYKEADIVTFPTRRGWRVRVTQIPCDCPKSRVPKAPEGCLQYFQGLTGEFKSFNFEGIGCYSEDRWCDFSTIKHPSDCDIRVGYTGHYNDLDYSICVEPESGFCGIQYQQMGRDGFSLTNATAYQDDSHIPSAEFADSGCMADYLWVPGAENDHGTDTHERFCGTKLGNARKWGTVTTYSKPFTVRMVSDADEFSLAADYMNRGFHISYSQIPCKLSG